MTSKKLISCSGEHKEFLTIANGVFNDHIPPQSMKDFVSGYRWYKEPFDDIHIFIEQAAKKLMNNGFYIDPKKWYMDVYSYHVSGLGEISPLTWHTDDKIECLYCKVNTMIICLQKDKTIIGGNLIAILDKVKQIIPIETETIILMRGDVNHMPEPVSGTDGFRKTIVLQFKRID